MDIEVYPLGIQSRKGIVITVETLAGLERILGDKIQLAKQTGAISTLIGDSSVHSLLAVNDSFPQYRGVVVLAPQEWVNLP